MNTITLWFQNISPHLTQQSWQTTVASFKKKVITHNIKEPYNISKTPLGKPYIPHECNPDHWHFSTSHTRCMIVMIWAQMQPVGVDVEAINRNISQKVIQRMFHPNEIAWLTKYPKQAIHFWTAKESLAKATGLGGYRSFKRFPIVSHKTDLTLKAPKPWHLKHIILNNHLIYITHTLEQPNIQIEEII